MITRFFTISVPLMLAGAAIALQPAYADVFTWVDKSGSINVSNLAPPDGSRVTNVIHATPVEIAAREAAAREATRQAEVQALAERVHQLESDAQLANVRPPPRMEYRSASASPMVQYVTDPTPPPQYAPYASPSSGYGCDPSQLDCSSWGIPGIYPANVILLRVPAFRRPPSHRDGHHFAAHQPSHSPVTHRG